MTFLFPTFYNIYGELAFYFFFIFYFNVYCIFIVSEQFSIFRMWIVISVLYSDIL